MLRPTGECLRGKRQKKKWKGGKARNPTGRVGGATERPSQLVLDYGERCTDT